MYWSDWSYGKNRMNSKLEQSLLPSKKESYFKHFFCFCSKKNNDYPIESVVYETKLPKQVRFTFNNI